MPKNPKNPGASYKKMVNESFKPSSFKYDKGVQADSTRVMSESLAKASARTGLKPKEPADLWHHYDESNSPKIDVNAGMKTAPVKIKPKS